MRWKQDYVVQAAQEHRIVAGFNVFGYEDAQAVIRAAERVGAPVLLMINRDARKSMAVTHWAALLGSLADQAAIPVGIHLDHCTETDVIAQAIDSDFTSVMFDGSKLPLQENLRMTQHIAQLAHKNHVFLEAELGTVPYSDMGETEIQLTAPEEARQMQEQTWVDWLAVSVGNIHRLAKSKVPIQFPVLQRIEQACQLPLVIHGASGIKEQDVICLKATQVGKMNFGTVLRKAFGAGLRREMEEHPDEFDRLRLFRRPVEQVEEQAYHIINMLWQEEKEPCDFIKKNLLRQDISR